MDNFYTLNYCPYCMEEMNPADIVCKKCGNGLKRDYFSFRALKPMTILAGRYLVGRTIGASFIGTSYIGLDIRFRRKVVIKEYFPGVGLASRCDDSNTLTWKDSKERDSIREYVYNKVMRLRSISGIPAMVTVRSMFHENNTMYYVRDYVEGESLDEMLKRVGALSYGPVLKILEPIMDGLSLAHSRGFIHQDITPDNIIVSPDGKGILLEPGMRIDEQYIDCMQQVMDDDMPLRFDRFDRFHPVECLGGDNRNLIKPCCDVYSISAVMFWMMSAKYPELALERHCRGNEEKQMQKMIDNLPMPVRARVGLRKALAIIPKDRIQSIAELKKYLE